ncbi:MAG: hypothetical protein PF588_01605 [Candidatus Kapabacteria bacterium]|jgi:hypothetical protein|nr:hypothetical protein [Candidatus Kapabacteria bacterium]
MKHFKLILVVIIAATFLLLSSCGDDTATNAPATNSDNYFPLTQSSEWEYDAYTLNMDGTVDADTKRDILMKISGVKKYGNIEYAGMVIQENDVETDKQYHYSDSWKLFVNKEVVEPTYEGLNLSFFLDKLSETIVIADLNEDKWVLLEDKVEDYDLGIEFMDVPVTLTGDITIICNKGVAGKVTLGDLTDVDAQEFTLVYSFQGTTIMNAPLDFSLTVHRWYAIDMGLVLETMDSESINPAGISIGVDIRGNRIVLKEATIQE